MPSRECVKFVPYQFRSQVTWARKWELQTALLGKDRLGRSALHAVSQVMGHTGILRTLESYQHLLGMAVGLHVNRQIALAHLPRQAIAALGLRERTTQIPEELGNSKYFKRVAASLDQLPGLYPDDKPFEVTVSRARSEGSFYHSSVRANLPPASSDNAFKLSWRLLLSLVNCRQTDSRALATEHGLDCDQVLMWRERYQQVISAAFAPGALPDGLSAPRGSQAQKVVDKIWSKLPATLSEKEKSLIAEFLNSFRSRRYHGIFKELADASDFADFLRAIGFSGDHLFIAAGPAGLIESYKKDPVSHLKPQSKGSGETRYRCPEDLKEKANERRADGSAVHPVVFWFRHMKFEADVLGLHYDTRYRLDPAQDRKDELLIALGKELTPRRMLAAEKRAQRAAIL